MPAPRLTGRYNCSMSSKLAKTNPYLRDPAVRERTVLKSVASSSAIEAHVLSFRLNVLPSSWATPALHASGQDRRIKVKVVMRRLTCSIRSSVSQRADWCT